MTDLERREMFENNSRQTICDLPDDWFEVLEAVVKAERQKRGRLASNADEPIQTVWATVRGDAEEAQRQEMGARPL